MVVGAGNSLSIFAQSEVEISMVKALAFSKVCLGLEDFGMAIVLGFLRTKAKSNWAGVKPYFPATSLTTGSESQPL